MVREGSNAIDIIPVPESISSFEGSFLGSPTHASYVNVPNVPHHIDVPSNGGHLECSSLDSAKTANMVHSQLPLDLLAGESLKEEEEFEGCRVALTDYRLCIFSLDNRSVRVVLLMAIESLDFKDPVQIIIMCKEGRVTRLTAKTNELAIAWHKKLMRCANRDTSAEAFAWQFSKEIAISPCSWLREEEPTVDNDIVTAEFRRLDFDPDHFRISNDNQEFELCETYPERMIIPKEMSKTDLMAAKEFRFLNRIPAVVWKCKETRAVLLRSSQPRASFFGWRNDADEKIFKLVHKYLDAYKSGKGEGKLLVVLDARSYTSAWANRAKGGGFECPEYYARTRTEWLGLPNIHHVRYSFHQLRGLLSSNPPAGGDADYLNALANTNWLTYLKELMKAAAKCVDILYNGQSVLVHCSDGWDRTTQIVSLAKLMGDEHYRTVKGFEDLIRTEWLAFGHKFSDRCGVAGTDANERCPIFLQFLDAVHQMVTQDPTAFQFNHQYLIKLAQHTYSGLFATFLFNSIKDARKMENEMNIKPVSIFRYLGEHNEEVVNVLYNSTITGRIECDTDICMPQSLSNRAVSMASSPAKDSVVTASQPMQKSKSSESISSVNNADGVSSVSLVGHCGSNGALNVTSEHSMSMDTSVMNEVNIPRRDTSARSPLKPWKTIKEYQDHDGLVRLFDPVQEQQRAISRAYKMDMLVMYQELTIVILYINERELEKRNEDLDIMKRNRSFSEKTNHSATSRDSGGRLVILFRYYHMSKYEVINGKLLRFCRISVCHHCSQKTYHTTEEDGKGVHKRMCDSCYSRMTPAGEIQSEEETLDIEPELPENPRTPSRPVSLSPPLSSPNGSFTHVMSPSQAVKG
uniref:Phosphatidylinositol-3-phosphatase n=1 Tax=Heterorhabditis bacteriophora TaxID=37862 RepID=A0A1I7XB52_HETBA